MRLEGKVALVTGAGSGIGLAIAAALAKAGADIAVNDIDRPSAEATASRIARMGRKSLAVQADVARAEDVGAMVSRVIDELGGAHILVNNAGIWNRGPMIEDQTAENWDRVVAVVLRGAYLCSRRVGQWMASHGGGKIVNVASVSGLVGSPALSSYGAANAGVINLTRSLASDWGKYNVNVNAVAPGFIDTPLSRPSIADEDVKRRIPLGRLGTAEDVANAVLFLVSEEASYITGATLPVDGGRLA